MNRHKTLKRNLQRGSVSIEAALVIPFTMIVFATILYFSHILYVENLIHSNMMMVSHKVAMTGYVFDKVGMVDYVQQEYQAGDEVIGDKIEQVDKINATLGSLKENSGDIISFKNDFENTVNRIRNGNSLVQTGKDVIALTGQFVNVKQNIGKDVEKLLEQMKELLTINGADLQGAAKSAGIVFFSNIISSNYAKMQFNKIISDKQLENMRVSNLKIIGGAYMIPDDTVSFTYSYDIFIPFITDYTDRSYKVRRSVIARAYTGSYDSKEVHKKRKIKINKYVYVATGSVTNSCYHVLSCLRKPLQSGSLYELSSRSVCEYCKKHNKKGSKAYYVSKNSKIHYNRHCPRIYSKKIKKMTEEEAKEAGYRPCQKRGCFGK